MIGSLNWPECNYFGFWFHDTQLEIAVTNTLDNFVSMLLGLTRLQLERVKSRYPSPPQIPLEELFDGKDHRFPDLTVGEATHEGFLCGSSDWTESNVHESGYQ